MSIEQMVDANLNRTCEGLRVIEDCLRFVYKSGPLQDDIRTLKHGVRKTLHENHFIGYRDPANDVGHEVSQHSNLDHKRDLKQLITANFKRVEEGLRSIEEGLKVLGMNLESKQYEKMRFKAYELEKKIMMLNLFPPTDIYGILCADLSLGRSNVQVAKDMIEAGVRVIQYREKKKDKGEKLKECLAIAELTKLTDCLFIVNDDIDIALIAQADGVHLGQEDIPILEARKLAPHMIIGVSTHNKDQALKAVKEGADYIGVGPVFNTQTKRNVAKSDGLTYVKWASQHVDIPQVNIGGIGLDNIALVKKEGGACFAMISELVSSKDIKKKVETIRKKLLEVKGDEHIA